jgi:hypothetical protein
MKRKLENIGVMCSKYKKKIKVHFLPVLVYYDIYMLVDLCDRFFSKKNIIK